MRSPLIYAETRYDYSKKIRQEILAVCGRDLSSETLRSLLKELKQQADDEPDKQEPSGDSKPLLDKSSSGQPLEIAQITYANAQVVDNDACEDFYYDPHGNMMCSSRSSRASAII